MHREASFLHITNKDPGKTITAEVMAEILADSYYLAASTLKVVSYRLMISSNETTCKVES